ncbi:NAD(P)/FAD-dependent oxidoreductase [Leptospira biflexa]|jgi:thioredoxin reductase|uniref:Putative thioredoxin-disulfide reductase n=1 Tax=Leptospira biflexa serovar Patoc (strain Patoc 1 / ATCC 23582 / Paris) TaxID=456481 RepID=B0SM49_LEPBP|nr:NAD(P)/FAD-dependent oxidoreductase [Leptospira biflexa]ABZ95004.1 Thioredoxin reductase [Leptospira biflexa serovar Patoc strain 'Patoc 1 (Ames)']ABZ98679.1 Putative thioredoxin-disulfide reductase [Leptospira biflexa serovar Patoc strain 'Patoc 1 (Paris)']TGM32245.1 NAD(P)/FAD-dependent oxidoreductase [Leptospira biflexa]TGM33811.1 NAD(P)/FAD-dependent oxidoreductase [Leptospira biflexa]TGM42547.1 NAD(P)/FAD-dependent oxidoreductase [Leptospira biflexa]
MESLQKADITIIGGSYSGLSAALTLVRSLRNVLVIDSERPCNQNTPFSHNFITHDGIKPSEIRQKALSDLNEYKTFKLQIGEATSIQKKGSGYLIKGNGLSEIQTDKIIFATGVKDILPEIPGFAQAWGKTVIHCPYCHGYEYVGNQTGLWMNEEGVYEHAKFLKHWSKEITIFTNGPVQFSTEEINKIESEGISIQTEPVMEIVQKDGKISGLLFQLGKNIPLQTLYSKIPIVQHSKLPEELGCKLQPSGHIDVSPFYETSVQGVYAIGDMASMFRTVAHAVYSGNIAGAMLNRSMILS